MMLMKKKDFALRLSICLSFLLSLILFLSPSPFIADVCISFLFFLFRYIFFLSLPFSLLLLSFSSLLSLSFSPSCLMELPINDSRIRMTDP